MHAIGNPVANCLLRTVIDTESQMKIMSVNVMMI